MKKKVLFGLLSIIAIAVLSALLVIRFNKKGESDAIKFSKEYGITEDNIFVYKNADEIIKILENGTGVVYLGFPECQWCSAYVPMLNEIAKENDIDKIYYYNISKDRKENTKEYQKIVSILDENLMYDDEGNKRIYVPDVTFILAGEIIGHNNETSVVTEKDGTPEDYWTQERKEKLKDGLNVYFETLNDNNMCTTGCND